MKKERCMIQGIPAIIWGEPSEKAYLFVHGKLSSKDGAAAFAQIAQEKGYQTLSFDLPQHGDRVEEPDRCDIWNGSRDLKKMCEASFARWKQVHLFGCSLGAYFCLHVCGDYPFRSCLFQSPIVDMEALIRQMMVWFDVTPERLEREGEVQTPIDTMSWDYYQYVLTHPVTRWDIPTAILYGGKDNLQSRQVMKEFADRFGCRLTVSEFSEHPFMQPSDALIVGDWMRRSVELGGRPLTHVYFVRHAQPVHNHQEDRTRPLTQEGRNDTALVTKVLADKGIDCFYSSPYLRSLDTIRPAAASYGLPIQEEERFRERQAGQKGNVSLREENSPLRRRWGDFSWHEPGGESIGQVQQRNVEALKEILAEHQGKRIAIGTHGTALSAILQYYRPSFGCEDFLRIIDWMPYIVELTFDGQKLINFRELAHIHKEFLP